MARFPGWTSEAVEKLGLVKKTDENLNKPVVNLRIPMKTKKKVDHVAKISAALTLLKVDHVREYRFLHDRRFKFDIAIPKLMIAVEFEGGVFTQGRHTRGTGYVNDVKKYNLATMHGWKLLRFTTADTNEKNYEYRIAQDIKDFVEGKNIGDKL